MQIIPILYLLKDDKVFLSLPMFNAYISFLSPTFPTCVCETPGRQRDLWLEIAGSGTVCPPFLHLVLQLAHPRLRETPVF